MKRKINFNFKDGYSKSVIYFKYELKFSLSVQKYFNSPCVPCFILFEKEPWKKKKNKTLDNQIGARGWKSELSRELAFIWLAKKHPLEMCSNS